MEETTQNKFSFKQMLPGLVISVGALAILLYLVDIEAVKDAIKLADYRYIPLTILIFFGTVTTRSIAWRIILQEKISLKKAFFTENEGYLLNNVLPFRLGEIGRAFLLGQTTPLSFWEVLSTIMVERIFTPALTGSLNPLIEIQFKLLTSNLLFIAPFLSPTIMVLFLLSMATT